MKVGVLGSVTTIFIQNYVEELKKNYDVFILNTSNVKSVDKLLDCKVYNVSNKTIGNGRFEFIKPFFKLLRLDTNIFLIKFLRLRKRFLSSSVTNQMLDALNEENPDILFSFWGTVTFPYIKLIKEEFPQIKIIHDVNTYPVQEKISWDESPGFLINDKEIFDLLDGIMYTSDIMRNFFEQNLKISKNVKSIIFFDSLNSNYSPRNRLLKLHENEKSLVFLGNTDFLNRTIDDVRGKIYSLANQRIHVYMQEPATGLKPSPYIHTFKSFSFDEMRSGLLSEFLTQFDGIIVLYNDFSDVRTNISIPTRLVLGLNSGIPIFVEGGKYLAIEELLKKYDFLSVIDDLSKIKIYLDDVDWDRMNENAYNSIRLIELDNRFDEIVEFINTL